MSDQVMSQETLSKLIGITAATEILGCTKARLRGAVKRNEVPGAYFVVGQVGFLPEELEGFTLPPVSKGRADGRRVHKVYLTYEEADTWREAGFEVEDVKAKVAKRKAAE